MNRVNNLTMIRHFSLLFVCLLAYGVAASPLHDYVAQPDEHYAWKVIQQKSFSGGTRYVLTMASQVWRTGQDVDRLLWRHWLVLNVPHQVKHDMALLFITGGNNSNDLPKPQNVFIDMALATHSITAELYNVPNQPLVFISDPKFRQRVEDDILAYGWAQFYQDRDPKWLVNLPMTKSAVRALDTIEAFTQQTDSQCPHVHKFVVSGASKRGWTTWLCAAADQRVAAIVPMVIDVLNIEQSINHHYQAYGGYSEALTPYVENHITDSLFTPQSQAATAIIDPYTYHQDITIPKLIINSTGDQFFLPDSTRFYFKDLPGPKYLRYIPNTDHGLNDTAADSLQSFYHAILMQKTWPTISEIQWKDGMWLVQASAQPQSVQLWQADNPQARDFRLDTMGEIWASREVEVHHTTSTGFQARANVTPPQQGWRAFMMEFLFIDPVDTKKSITLTTEVTVVPDTMPFKRPRP